MYELTQQNKALKNMLGAVCIMLAVSIGIICYQAFTITGAMSEVIVIKDQVNNDLHNVMFSYRDTVALDNLPEAEYQKLITDHILPRSSD